MRCPWTTPVACELPESAVLSDLAERSEGLECEVAERSEVPGHEELHRADEDPRRSPQDSREAPTLDGLERAGNRQGTLGEKKKRQTPASVLPVVLMRITTALFLSC